MECNQDIICTIHVLINTLIVRLSRLWYLPLFQVKQHIVQLIYELFLCCLIDNCQIFQGDLILHSDRVVENVTKIVIHGKKSDACRVISETR